MKTTKIRPGRYLIETDDGRTFYATRNDHARPTYWNVEPADDAWAPESCFAADTLREAKESVR